MTHDSTQAITGVAQINLRNVCESLVTLFDPFAQVVVHDLKTQTITDITRGLNGREVGDPSFIDDFARGAGGGKYLALTAKRTQMGA